MILTSLKKIVTGDESCCFAYNPATTWQLYAWVGEKLAVAAETSIPKVSSEERVGDFRRLTGSRPPRKDGLLALNSTKKL
jgi:hypothetical protein